LGSTGSVGTQALDVVRRHPDRFKVVILSAKRASRRLLEQAKAFEPDFVITEEPAPDGFKRELPTKTKHLTGLLGLSLALERTKPKKVLNAVSGIFGIEPSFRTLEHSNALLLLANKETVVAAGELLKPYLERIVPVDSEHNALFQVLRNLKREEVKKLYLTASGGPFRGMGKEELKRVRPEQALKHPRWRMGKKITVDSATLMNKGFEVIEARYLFEVPVERVEVLVHPQSLVHGIVETVDGHHFLVAYPTDMRYPLQHALFYPERVATDLPTLSWTSVGKLEFERPDFDTFECLKLAYEYGRRGFPHTALLVGADEAAVELFLEGKISFTDIPALVKRTVEALAPRFEGPPTVERAVEAAAAAYAAAKGSA